MGLLQKLLSTIGLRDSQSGRGSQRAGETTVTVEHEPDTGSEDAVKGTESVSEGSGGVSEDTAASGSTATITDTADEETGATEPSEAAGDAAGDLDEEPDVETDQDEGDEASADEAASDEEASDEGASADDAPTGSGESPDVLNGIGPAYAERLSNAGVDSVADLAAADAGELAEKTDLGEGRLANWIEQAKEY